MTLDVTAEIDAMLAEQGQDVTIAGVTAKAMLNTTDLGLLAGELTEVDAGLIVFEAKTGAFPGLAVGASLVSNSITYKIRQWLRVGDGRMTQIFCTDEGGGPDTGIFGEADIDAMLAESPVQATIGGITAPVLWEPVGERLQEGAAGAVQATKILVTCKTRRFPALRPGVEIVILGTTYVAVDVKRSGDGGLSQILCGLLV